MAAVRTDVVEVADNVFALGTEHVNWYVVVDGASITVVDTGLPRYWGQLERLLSSIGREVADIQAVVLTHADPDHLGNAGRIAVAADASIVVHSLDAPAALGKVRIPPPRLPIWRPAVLTFLVHGIRNGLVSWDPPAEVDTIEHGGVLDVPGQPNVIPVPGHTPGSICVAFDDRDALFVGDALVNKDPVTGEAGCRIGPAAINADHQRAIDSLAALDSMDHGTVLFGHGAPFDGGLRRALSEARDRLSV